MTDDMGIIVDDLGIRVILCTRVICMYKSHLCVDICMYKSDLYAQESYACVRVICMYTSDSMCKSSIYVWS